MHLFNHFCLKGSDKYRQFLPQLNQEHPPNCLFWTKQKHQAPDFCYAHMVMFFDFQKLILKGVFDYGKSELRTNRANSFVNKTKNTLQINILDQTKT